MPNIGHSLVPVGVMGEGGSGEGTILCIGPLAPRCSEGSWESSNPPVQLLGDLLPAHWGT